MGRLCRCAGAQPMRGIPRPRSLMMFFWICDVPPPMTRPSVNMNSIGQVPRLSTWREVRASVRDLLVALDGTEERA